MEYLQKALGLQMAAMPPNLWLSGIGCVCQVKRAHREQSAAQARDAEAAECPAQSTAYMDKVMRQILQERGLFIPGMTKDGGKDRDKSMSMSYALGEQSDFKAVEPSLKIRIERLGGPCLMLPKNHCELNPTEMFWGRGKHYVRAHCDYTLPGMRANIPVCLKEEGGLFRVIVESFFRMSNAFH
ncbi:unnamed protein product, partial [Discosporangium mesarthrocarpum]